MILYLNFKDIISFKCRIYNQQWQFQPEKKLGAILMANGVTNRYKMRVIKFLLYIKSGSVCLNH